LKNALANSLGCAIIGKIFRAYIPKLGIVEVEMKLLLFCLLLAGQARAAQAGVDFTDGIGGLLGLGAVFFFAYLCFRGDKHPPEGLEKKK
jgi:hypothetical protein